MTRARSCLLQGATSIFMANLCNEQVNDGVHPVDAGGLLFT